MKLHTYLTSIEPEALAGVGLPEYPPFPNEMVISGISKHQAFYAFNGEIGVGVYQAAPAKLILDDCPKDEFMYVLSGKVTVTETGAPPMTFFPGQGFVIHRGFKGTFEMFGDFRKLAVSKYEHSEVITDWLSKQR